MSFKSFSRYLAAFPLAIFFVLQSAQVEAHEPDASVVCQQSLELRCAADDMRDEIKTHFCKTKCYRKLLGVNSQIQTRSAAVVRRTKRNPCYRGMDRDVAKLTELVCELNELYESSMHLSFHGVGRRPVVGDTCHVVEKLAAMSEMVACLNQASLGETFTFVSQPVYALSPAVAPNGQTLIIPEYNPNLDVAPGVTPPTQYRIEDYQFDAGQLDYDQGTTLPMETPSLNAPTPATRSVIER